MKAAPPKEEATSLIFGSDEANTIRKADMLLPVLDEAEIVKCPECEDGVVWLACPYCGTEDVVKNGCRSCNGDGEMLLTPDGQYYPLRKSERRC